MTEDVNPDLVRSPAVDELSMNRRWSEPRLRGEEHRVLQDGSRFFDLDRVAAVVLVSFAVGIVAGCGVATVLLR